MLCYSNVISISLFHLVFSVAAAADKPPVTFQESQRFHARGIAKPETYTFKGDPYSDAMPPPFDVAEFAVSPLDGNRSVGAIIYTPKLTNTSKPTAFKVMWFVGGFDGYVRGWAYEDVLRGMAARGIISIAVDDIRCSYMVDYPPFLTPARAWDHISFLDEYLPTYLAANGVLNVVPDFNKISLGCHSGGCDVVASMNLPLFGNASIPIGANLFLGPYFNPCGNTACTMTTGQLLSFYQVTTPALTIATVMAEYGYDSPQSHPHCITLLNPTPTPLYRTANPNPNPTVSHC